MTAMKLAVKTASAKKYLRSMYGSASSRLGWSPDSVVEPGVEATWILGGFRSCHLRMVFFAIKQKASPC